ncbi:MAG: VTC domain-containing protein [Oscillospiraceae bacterium]
MAYGNTFMRTEKKFILTAKQAEQLRTRLADYITADQYGEHTICNIYLDTDDFLVIRRSIEKPVFKEKLRLRSYGVPTRESPVFLEIKKKYKGVVYKRRVSLPYSEAYGFVTGASKPAGKSDYPRDGVLHRAGYAQSENHDRL